MRSKSPAGRHNAPRTSSGAQKKVLVTIVTTIIASLVIAGILALAKSHWLYLVVPKLYLNTPLSTGHVISLSLMNAGFPPEEDVRIRLKTTCKYEFLAASNSAVSFSNNTVHVPRISRFETLTLLLLVEGKTFEASDVEAVESKGTTGKVVQKKEQVSSPWQHLVILPIFLIFLLVPFSFGTWLGKEMQASALDYLIGLFDPLTPSKQLAGYNVETEELHPLIAGQLAKATFDGRISLRFSEIVRRGDILHMTLIVANNTKQTLIVHASAKSSASERGPLGFGDSRADDVFIGAGSERTLRLKAFLPETSNPRVVVLEYRFNLGRDSSTLQQTITFN